MGIRVTKYHAPKSALLPSGYVNRQLLAQTHDQHIAGTASAGCMPLWISSPTKRGRSAFNYLFRRCVLERWEIQLDKKTLTVDPRLHRLEQPALLKELCGKPKWETLLRRDRLLSGLEAHYKKSKGKILSAFKENFPWAFDENTPGHLHDNDFYYEGMYLDVKEKGIIWNLLDHFIRVDIGVILYDPQTKQFDRRLLPENRGQLAKELGYLNWSDLEKKVGLVSILRFCPIAEGTRTKSGSLGKLLAWRYPLVFSILTKGHFDIGDFDVAGISSRQDENKKLLIHIMATLKIDLQRFTRRVTRQILLDNGFPITPEESALEVFCRHFDEEIKALGPNPEFLYAEIESDSNQAWFKIDGTIYSFPAEAMYRCLRARQVSAEEIIIYARPTKRAVGKGDLAARHVIKIGSPDELIEVTPELLAAIERKLAGESFRPPSHFI